MYRFDAAPAPYNFAQAHSRHWTRAGARRAARRAGPTQGERNLMVLAGDAPEHYYRVIRRAQ